MLKGEALRQATMDALYKAEELLRIGWCKTWGQDKDGKPVDPTDESACAWCLEGALIAGTKLVHDPEEAAQIRQAAVAIIQSANKPMADKINRNRTKVKLGESLGSTHIHKASVIPSFNDASASTQEEVVSWVQRARQLVNSGIVKFK